MLFSLWLMPRLAVAMRPPTLLLTSVDELVVDPMIDSLRELVGGSLFLAPRQPR